MTRDEIERDVREALSSETTALALSRKLFQPDGLFAKLATNEQERRALTRSPLFVEAQRLLSELQRKEAAEFSRSVPQTPVPGLVLQLLDGGAG